jgi:TonB family protein
VHAPTLAGLALLLCGCAARPSPSAPPPAAARFRAPEELLLLPDGSEEPQPITPGQVRYPMGEFKRGQGATLVVALVVDTTGAVEHRTISFLETAGPPFVKAVCNALKSARFAPAISQGRRRRSLVVMPFRFTPLDDVLRGLPAVDVASRRRALAEQPRDSAIAYLERAPHCP